MPHASYGPEGSSKIAETKKQSNEILLNPKLYLIFDPLLESKLLSTLLDDEPYLQAISELLDTTLARAGNYRAVAQYYGLNHYTISAVLEKYDKGPTTALIERLAATRTQLTVQEFAAVVRQKAKREDVAELLEAYDSGKKLGDDPLLESELLSSLLDDEPYLQAISELLDTTLAGAGNYRAVAQYYGLNHYTISAFLEKYDKGPTTGLIVRLAATRTQLTVQ